MDNVAHPDSDMHRHEESYLDCCTKKWTARFMLSIPDTELG